MNFTNSDSLINKDNLKDVVVSPKSSICFSLNTVNVSETILLSRLKPSPINETVEIFFCKKILD